MSVEAAAREALRVANLEPSKNGNGRSEGRLRVRPADLTRVRPIRWAWRDRLPLGYLGLLLGAEGVGKGTLVAWLIARLTRGELPGDLRGEPVRVLIVGDEDSFDSVIVPRLYTAGADLALVDTLADDDEDDLLDLRRDAGKLRELLIEGGYRVVYIDALLDTLGLDVDDWRSKPVRDAIRPVRRAARDVDVSILAALHPNKGSRGTFRDLVSGTHAFNASSRSSLLLAEHPEDEDRRVLVRGKGNLSAAPPSLEFAIESRELEINGHGFSLPIVADMHEGDLRVEDIVKPQRPAQSARTWPTRSTRSARVRFSHAPTSPGVSAASQATAASDVHSTSWRQTTAGRKSVAASGAGLALAHLGMCQCPI